MNLKTADLSRRQKTDLLVRVREVVADELHQVIKVRQQYTGKEISQACGLDPARVSEIMAITPKPFAEQTLRKLIGGGVVKVTDIIKKVNPTEEERAYLAKFRAYEDSALSSEIDKLSQAGVDVARILNTLNKLHNKGISVSDILDNLLNEVGISSPAL